MFKSYHLTIVSLTGFPQSREIEDRGDAADTRDDEGEEDDEDDVGPKCADEEDEH